MIVNVSGRELRPDRVLLCSQALCRLSDELLNKYERDTVSFTTYGSSSDIIVGAISNAFVSSLFGDSEKINQYQGVIDDIDRYSQWFSTDEVVGSSADSLFALSEEKIALTCLYPEKAGLFGRKSYFRGVSLHDERRLRQTLSDDCDAFVTSPFTDYIDFEFSSRARRIRKSDIFWVET